MLKDYIISIDDIISILKKHETDHCNDNGYEYFAVDEDDYPTVADEIRELFRDYEEEPSKGGI